MRFIHLVRHAEAAQRWAEAADPGLSEAGHSQALALASRVAGHAPRALHTSPLLRAQQTAAPLAARWQIPATITPAFREVPGPGALAERPAWLARLMGSTWREVDAPVIAWRDALWQALFALPGEAYVFTHFMVINAVVALAEAAERVVVFEPDYCSVTTLRVQDGAVEVIARGTSRDTRVL